MKGVGNELEYAPREADTLVGTINAVHDILGMIITEDEMPQNADQAYDNQIYYSNGSYYCTVPSVVYEDIEFTNEDFERTPESFASEYQDRATIIPDLKQYGGIGQTKQYYFIKTDDTPTYMLSEADNGVAGALYYSIPSQLRFAGNMVASREERDYYAANGRDFIITQNGEFDIAKHGTKEMYRIPITETYDNTKQYYSYNETYHSFKNITSEITDAEAFTTKVNSNEHLYAEGEFNKKIISRASTLYQVRYTTSGGVEKMQPLGQLGAGTDTYVNNLGSKQQFLNFLQRYMTASITGENATVDYTQLYIASSIIQQDNGQYAIFYDATPISKILFDTVDAVSGYYDNIYIKTNNNYYRAHSTRDLNTEGTEYTCYKIMPIMVTVYEDDKYWCITVPADQQSALVSAREANTLETITTSNYHITKIVKSKDGFRPQAIYWTIPNLNANDPLDTGFAPVGYGISEKYNAVEDDPSLDIYYVPNTLYYKDANTQKYILADSLYEFNQSSYSLNKLYRINELFITDIGDLYSSGLKRYGRWNNNLITSTDDIWYYFADQNTVNINTNTTGHGVKIGYKLNRSVWKELVGFGRDLNTIHG